MATRNPQPPQPTKEAVIEAYHHDRRLLALSPVDELTLRTACENILCFGAIGSGKSSGVLHNITLHLFRSRPKLGGVICPSKSDDVAFYQAIAAETGREEDVVLVDPASGWGLNWLRFEDERTGPGAGMVENMVALLSELQEVASRKPGFHDAEGAIWKAAAEDILRAAISTVKFATGRVDLQDVRDVISSAPRRSQNLDEEALRRSRCFQLLVEAEKKARETGNPELIQDSGENSHQFMSGFRNYAEDTATSVLFNVNTLLGVFLRHPLRSMWCGDLMNLQPSITFGDDGSTPKIILFNIPTLEWGAKVGAWSQIGYLKVWMDSVLRREITEDSQLTFAIADELHEVYSRSCSRWTSLNRSFRACLVGASQNISNLRAVVGSDDLLDSFLANISLKFFCANSGPTNKYMSELIGQYERLRPSWTRGRNEDDDLGTRSSRSFSYSYDREYYIQPYDIYGLKRGGPDDEGIVEAVAFAGGRPFAGNGGLPWLKVTFLTNWKRRQIQSNLKEAN